MRIYNLDLETREELMEHVGDLEYNSFFVSFLVSWPN